MIKINTHECSSCGNSVEAELTRCPNCGAFFEEKFLAKKNNLTTSQFTEGKSCPKCGKYNEEGSNFCIECGARLIRKETPQIPPPESHEILREELVPLSDAHSESISQIPIRKIKKNFFPDEELIELESPPATSSQSIPKQTQQIQKAQKIPTNISLTDLSSSKKEKMELIPQITRGTSKRHNKGIAIVVMLLLVIGGVGVSLLQMNNDDENGHIDGNDVDKPKDAFPNDPAASEDSDGDGYPDEWNTGRTEEDSTTGLTLDAFPTDPAASKDSDSDGYPDEWNTGKTQADSTTGLTLDAFPNDPAASKDTDSDGYPDEWNEGMTQVNSTMGLTRDAFLTDPAASKDTDDDGHPNEWNTGKTQEDSTTGLTLDGFPYDPAASKDTDSDGYPDEWNERMTQENSTTGLTLDVFPNDPAAGKDSDGDGYPDEWNTGKTQEDSTTGLTLDAFPNDPAASKDTDGDGYPDEWNEGKTQENSTTGLTLDAFPNDPAASKDTDSDGYPDEWNEGKTQEDSTTGLTLDAFPTDPAASKDFDSDGYPDEWNTGNTQENSTTGLTLDAFPDDEHEWLDTDNDETGNNADVDDDNDGYNDTVEISEGTDPLDNTSKPLDTDRDFIPDSTDTDDDNDGYNDSLEISEGTDPLDNTSKPLDTDGDFIPDSTDADDDNDGVSDEDEEKYGSNSTDPSDVKNVTGALITINKPATRGDFGTSYLIENLTGLVGRVIPVVNPDNLTGYGHFTLVFAPAGNHIYSSDVEAPKAVSSNFHDYPFTNIEVEINALSSYSANYTFGMGISNDSEFAFMYPGNIPTFFTDVHLKGVILPTGFFNKTSLFEFELFGDSGKLKGELDRFATSYNGTNQVFVYVSEIDYSSKNVEGDVYSVITPEKMKTLSDLFDSTATRYLSNLTSKINSEFLILMERNSTLTNTTYWFIFANTDLSEEELYGIIELNVTKSDISTLSQRLGIEFPEEVGNITPHFKVGVCNSDSPEKSSGHEVVKIAGLWGEMGSPPGAPMVKGVNISAFAFVVTLDDILSTVDDVSVIEFMTSFENPGFAFLIDMDFINFIKGGSYNLTHAVEIAILPNYEGEMLTPIQLKGVLYDTGKYLETEGIRIPLVIADDYEVDCSYSEKELNEIEAYGANSLTKGVTTHGYLTGSTLKTVGGASYPQISDFPLDIGFYDLNKEIGGKRYHVPLIEFSVEKGNTYLARYGEVKGIYVNFEEAKKILNLKLNDIVDIGGFSKEMLEDNFFAKMFDDIIEGFDEMTGSVHMLKGFILISDFSLQDSLDHSEYILDVYRPPPYDNNNNEMVFSENEHKLKLWITVTGSLGSLEIKMIVTTPKGEIGYQKNPVGIPFDFDFTGTPQTLNGTYKVEVYLMGLSLIFGETADYEKKEFTLKIPPYGDSGDTGDKARVLLEETDWPITQEKWEHEHIGQIIIPFPHPDERTDHNDWFKVYIPVGKVLKISIRSLYPILVRAGEPEDMTYPVFYGWIIFPPGPDYTEWETTKTGMDEYFHIQIHIDLPIAGNEYSITLTMGG